MSQGGGLFDRPNKAYISQRKKDLEGDFRSFLDMLKEEEGVTVERRPSSLRRAQNVRSARNERKRKRQPRRRRRHLESVRKKSVRRRKKKYERRKKRK